MNILILPSWYPCNIHDTNGVFFRDQAIALQCAGHDVSVISASLRSIRTFSGSAVLEDSFELDEGVKTYRKEVWAGFPRIPFGNYFLQKWATFRLFKEYIKQNGLPDIIHAHSLIYAGIIAAELGKKYKIPVVLTEHSSGFARELYRDWQLSLASRAVKNLAYRIAVSEPFANLLEEKLGKRWTYLPNIVAERFFSKDLRKEKTNNDMPVLLNIALMTSNKGQKNLLLAISILKQRSVEITLWFAGDGPIRAEIERYSDELGLTQQVKFLGMVKPAEVPELLSRADLLVVSSEYETFGVVAAEALSLGKPVVATRCGGPESIVEQGDGLLVPPKDPLALADAIQDVSDNLADYDASDISIRARERFGPAAIATQLSEIYSRVSASESERV